ncbi:phasin family protein [Entomomonas asaccharolytica]|uniref:Phasin family protein n=1 Tax=Entomomonas asaccharolytica TaxID=2785331 RepID=A0A974RWG0_9GAMM|nr:phasin family protein [Entomomonas asaccharolytica]QQP85145.1 phasin family protein [Entomomonas asaccharolytica]
MATFNTDKLQDVQVKNLDLLKELSDKVFEGVEQLTQLQLNTLKASSEESFENFRKLLTVRDPQSFASLQASLSQPAAQAERILEFNRQVYDLISKTQASISKLAENQVNQGGKQVQELVENIVKNAPAGSEPVVSVLKSALEGAGTAYESLQKAAKKVAEMTENNINAATVAADKATKAATSRKAS